MPASAKAPALLAARRITKRFPGVQALTQVDLEVEAGQVVAVMGENGAGKSTLMKVLAGVHAPDDGVLLLDGKPTVLRSVRDAEARGIALIHQELMLCDNLSVGASLFLGREPRCGPFIAHRKIWADSSVILQRLGLDIDPRAIVADLSMGQQQLVEIARALALDARLLIMDEPTSSLSAADSERLFTVVKELAESGVAILYISHRMTEVKRLCDKVVVLRDGFNVGELRRQKIDPDAMVRMMVGRDLDQVFPRSNRERGPVRLDVHGLRTRAWPGASLNFAVHGGEVVCLAGLVGSGRSELLRAVFGADPRVAGRVDVDGSPATIRAPVDAVGYGVALVPEDRKGQGLMLDETVRRNVSLVALRADARHGFVDSGAERRRAAQAIAQLEIKTPNDAQPVRFLSGGNQQKVVLGKWLALQPCVLLLDEPTRGVDVGAKAEIYRLIDELATSGVAVLCVTSEMEEVIGLGDRVLVMAHGQLRGELVAGEATEEAILRLATVDRSVEATS